MQDLLFPRRQPLLRPLVSLFLTDISEGLTFKESCDQAALDPQLLATDLADYLVRAGVPFRKAHEVVATVVRLAEDQGVTVDQLSLEAFQEAHAAFGSDVFDVFDWERSVEAREAPGGTARKAVLDQIAAAQTRLQ